MERLTEHHYNKTVGAYMVCSGACIDDDFDCNDCKKLAEIVDRLAAYEDTGLEPEEIVALQKRGQGLAELLAKISCGCAVTYERLQELAQAEKDGRLVVLPCKPGSTAFILDRAEIPQEMRLQAPDIRFVCLDDDNLCRVLCDGKGTKLCAYRIKNDGTDIGKRIFLTRAEAEAALKKREEADND